MAAFNTMQWIAWYSTYLLLCFNPEPPVQVAMLLGLHTHHLLQPTIGLDGLVCAQLFRVRSLQSPQTIGNCQPHPDPERHSIAVAENECGRTHTGERCQPSTKVPAAVQTRPRLRSNGPATQPQR